MEGTLRWRVSITRRSWGTVTTAGEHQILKQNEMLCLNHPGVTRIIHSVSSCPTKTLLQSDWCPNHLKAYLACASQPSFAPIDTHTHSQFTCTYTLSTHAHSHLSILPKPAKSYHSFPVSLSGPLPKASPASLQPLHSFPFYHLLALHFGG